MKHKFTISTAAAANLLIKAARISVRVLTLVADVVEGRRDVNSCPWEESGAEALALAEELRRAISRSQRARQAAQNRRAAKEVPTVAPADPELEAPFEMRRTSRGMEKFYRWPDRSWRRTAPTPDDITRLSCRRKRGRHKFQNH